MIKPINGPPIYLPFFNSRYAVYRGVVRGNGYSGLVTNYFKEQTTVMASKLSTSVFQRLPACEAYESKFKPAKTS